MVYFLELQYFGSTVLAYLTSVAIILGGWIGIIILHRIFIRRVREWTKNTRSTFDDFIISVADKTIIPLLYFGVLYAGLQNLSLHRSLDRALNVTGVVVFTLMAIRFLTHVVRYAIFSFWIQKHANRELLETQFKGFMPAITLIIWFIGLVFLMDNLGLKISTVIAGLGIGGVAVALASQAFLADLFSYFAIMFDRPFAIGDFIIAGDHMGTVEHIGIKTTRIRSLSGEQLIFCNKDLTSQTVSNYKRMRTRRIAFKFGLSCETKPSQLREIPQVIKGIIAAISSTAFDRAHFFNYGDFSLVYEVVYMIDTDDYNKYMDIQQEINIRMKEEFEKRHIEFAYPTQTIQLRKLVSNGLETPSQIKN